MDCCTFETGPIRPPSEASSLLLRVSRNCPWNRCTFCPVYKGQRFSLRGVDEIVADIRAMAQTAERVRALSLELGQQGQVTVTVVHALADSPQGRDALQIAHFLRAGGTTAFLQDANSLILPVDRLVRVLRELRRSFPSIQRVTSYARAHTVVKRSVDDLRQLLEAGLDRIHIGLESGSDRVLQLVEKGVTAAKHIDAGTRVKDAGIELSEYVMPGLGGRALSEEHARDTAEVLRAIDPHFIRLRTLAIPSGSPLEQQHLRGEFEPIGDVAIARELRAMLAGLQGMTGRVTSDHVLNLLEEVEGQLPRDLPRMLAIIDRFLALDDDERDTFIVGRRLLMLRRLDDLSDPLPRARAQLALQELRQRFPGPVEHAVRQVRGAAL